MPKSKNRKDQKARSKNRTQKMKEQRKSFEKKYRDALMDQINKEKEKGLFNNLPNIETIGSEPQINIDGPLI